MDESFWTNEAQGDCFERWLMRYVLVDAVERWREGKKEAYRWLFTDPDDHWMSFENVCTELGFDFRWLRKKLLERRTDISFFGRSVSQIVKRA